jgi:hypothetical protein
MTSRRTMTLQTMNGAADLNMSTIGIPHALG